MSDSGSRERHGNLQDVDIVNSRTSASEPGTRRYVTNSNGCQQPGNIYGKGNLAGGKGKEPADRMGVRDGRVGGLSGTADD